MKKLLLTGANGFLGKILVQEFLKKGWEITVLVRKFPEHKSPNVHYILFDLEKPELASLSGQFDAFIHAGYVKASKGINAYDVNVNGAKYVLDHLEGQISCQCIFISSLSAKENALSEYGRQKFAIEKLFAAVNGTSIRAGLILGNGGLFASMRSYLEKKSLIPLFGNGLQPIQSVHVNDLVHALLMIAEQKIQGRYVIAEEEPVPYRTFYEALCRSLGKKPKFIQAGFGLAGFLIGAAEMIGMNLPVNKENLSGLKQMEHVPSQNDLTKLGLKLRTWKESLEELATKH